MSERMGDGIHEQGKAMKRRGVIAQPEAVLADRSRPALARPITASRRTLLKGAGAALFTTALLATGEVVPITPFAVAAADPPPRPSGPMTAIATTADTLYQTFTGTDFHPEITSKGEIGFYSPNATYGAGPIYSAVAGTTNFSARLHLPQGATITEVIFYVIHNDSAAMTVDIGAFDAADAAAYALSTASVSTTSGNIQAITLTPNAVVDTSQHSYVIEWTASTASPAHQLYGARVGYTLPGPAQVYGSAQSGIGVNGQSVGGYGVEGYSVSAGGIGVLGASSAGTGVKGAAVTGFPIIGQAVAATNTAAGVLGAGTAGPGVQGQSTGGHGLVGTTDATDGHAGLTGNANNTGGVGLQGIAPNYGTMTVGRAGDFYGNVKITGGSLMAPTMQAVVPHATDGTYRTLHTVTSPEGWVEDVGEGTLAGGTADVKLDADFAALIHTDTYHVFLTPYSPLHLHVAARTASGFTVVATPSGVTGAGGPKRAEGAGTFSWKVQAKRKDITSERLAKVAAPTAPKIPTAFTIPATPTVTPPTKNP